MLTPKFGLVYHALEELHLVSIDLKSQTELEMSVFKNTEAFPNLVELDLSENKGFNFVKIAKNLKNLKRLTTF